MSDHRSRPLIASALSACALLAAACTPALPDQSDARITVTASQPAGPYQPGDDIAFRVTVTNAGSRDVTLLSIDTTLDAQVTEKSLSCTGSGPSAVGPTYPDCADFVYLQGLAAGKSVTLDFVATIRAGAQGSITNTFSAAVSRGPAKATATNGSAIVDARSGTYQAYASNGQAYALAIDFASATATFSGAGVDVLRPFTGPSRASDSYFFTTGTGLRGHHDLLAGTVDLGGGATPFIAGRAFVTTLGALDGRSFNTFDVETSTGGVATSRMLSTAFIGATMVVCSGGVPQPAATCPGDALSTYALSVAGDVFTGVDAVHGDTATFRVARSGDAMILLRAQASSAGRRFQVGLATNPGIVAMHFEGGDTQGRWGALALSPSGLTEAFAKADGTFQNLAGAVAAVAGAPQGLSAGLLDASSSPVYLAADNGLAIVLGQPGSALDGLIQVFDY